MKTAAVPFLAAALSLSALTAVAAPSPALAAAPLASMAAVVNEDGGGLEKTTTSNVIPMTVLFGAHRSTSEEDVSKFAAALDKFAGVTKSHVSGAAEVLIWNRVDDPRKKMPMLLLVEGYRYAEQQTIKMEGEARMTPFTLAHKDNGNRVLGVWVESGDAALLAWAPIEGGPRGDSPVSADDLPSTPAAPPPAPLPRGEVLPPDSDDRPTASVARRAPGGTGPAAKNGRAPAEVLGEWRWTTIHGHYFVDERTGRYAGDGGGMAVHFTFLPNGRYKMFFFVKMRPTVGLGSQSTTTEEGTVTFRPDGTFVTHPEKGWYKGIQMNGALIDRPMAAHERKEVVYGWKWDGSGAGRTLQISRGGKEGPYSTFKKAN